ncbi:MAG: glycosyltransferase [Solirubrobacterales bacterium]|nr:glycosyltransferase [Solirubrobacterales bacterium]
MDDTGKLTVAIPLHRAAQWIEGIEDIVSRVPDWASVIISDASGLDDSVERLAVTYAADPRISVVSRDQSLDWREHANLLLAGADTEYFCWMPQDDLVSPDSYFESLVGALDSHPGRSLAFPRVVKRVTTGRLRRREIGLNSFTLPPICLGTDSAESEALEMLGRWNIAMAWRGVFRRKLARPIPPTTDAPDLIWTFSMALAGNFIEVPEAQYLKRFHRQSAHRTVMRRESASRVAALYGDEVAARFGGEPRKRDAVLAELRPVLARRRRARMVRPLRRARRFAANTPRVVFESKL